ncbi:2'-5' RNA ligase family protein [Actinomadura hibisca]|uniref:2'-5' RNA ligase family protein n=1 Tax=Actinomadura hibisca TaxID=68565 RepID=UPI00082B2080|nr:2'-5' RNA ligase family protein [Actinomadura hibisca]
MIPVLREDQRSFPPSPPTNLNDPATITAHDWTAFQRLETMQDHWNRPPWHDGHRAYYWMLTFSDVPALVKTARLCQEALTPLRMDDVPEDGLHITITKIGQPDQVDLGTIDALADQALSRIPAAFTADVHPLTASRGAVRCSVTPWSPLIDLHAALTEVNAQAGVPGGKPTSRFRPHLGVTYNNQERPTGPVAALVAPLRTLPPVNVRIASVELVELRREGRTYRWDVLYSLPLGSEATSDHLL